MGADAGQGPRVSDEIARTMHQRISNSTLEIIPDAAHAGIFEAPDRSADVILRWVGQMM